MLAGMSVDYYTASSAETSPAHRTASSSRSPARSSWTTPKRPHLFDLARAADCLAPRIRRRRSPQTVRPSVQRVIDAIVTAPAWVRNDRGDVLAANELGRALYLDLMAEAASPPNNCALHLPEPESPRVLRRLGTAADDIVAILRSAGREEPVRQGPHRPRSVNSPPAARSSAPGGPATT